MKNILELLEKTAGRLPDKAAFVGENETLTFRQLYGEARRIGSALLRMGVTRQPVAVQLPRSPRAIAAFLGAVYAGCFYVPLEVDIPPGRLAAILDSLHPGAVIDENAYTALTVAPEDAVLLQAVRENQIDTDPVYMVYTSGSTGTPKGVVGCHRALLDYAGQLGEVLQCTEETIFGCQVPLSYDACLKEILCTLLCGAATYLLPKPLLLQPVKLVEFLNDKKINTLCWVVSALTYVSSFKTFDYIRPQHLRTVAFASEVFPIRELNRWRAAVPGARFLNLYGPTETTGVCCYFEVDREFGENEVLPIGKPFPNTQILLLNGQNQTPPPGEPGEICIRGSRLTMGYYDDFEKTNARFVQNPQNPHYPERIYRTGDLGAWNPRGELVFLGRMDSQIKHLGHRIELGAIEGACRGQVTAVCCVYNGEIILYYVGDVTPDALKKHLRGQLPRHELPHRVIRLETMPLTPNGKTDRKQLLERSKTHGETAGYSVGNQSGGGLSEGDCPAGQWGPGFFRPGEPGGGN